MNASTRLALGAALACSPLLAACDSAEPVSKEELEERVSRFERPHANHAVRRPGGMTSERPADVVDGKKEKAAEGTLAQGEGQIAYEAPFDGTPAKTETLDGGLVVDEFVIGEGEEATEGGKVTVHYTGYLKDGTVFDSSVSKNRPFSFPLGQGRVIKGWDQGVEGMKVGGKRRLLVPAALGYKERRMGKIPPNSDLVFTIELLAVSPPLPDPQPDSAFEGTPLSTDEKDDGLVIEVFQEGEGEGAEQGDVVSVHYTGTLSADGTEFDSSVSKKRPPIEFPLGMGRVIVGWDKGLEGMKAGELRKLKIPAALGYRDKAKGKIPANSDLTFTVEMMAITSKPK